MGIKIDHHGLKTAFLLSVIAIGCITYYYTVSWTNLPKNFTIIGGNSKTAKEQATASDKIGKTRGVLEGDSPRPVNGSSYVTKDNRRYLLHVHWDLTGPNVQYNSFRMGVAYAEYSGRRIVEPLFFPHWTQDRSNRGVRTFNETYDAGRLNELVKVSTFEEFHRACNSSVDILLVAPTKHISAEDYQPKRDFYSQAYNISIPPYHKIPSSFDERVDALRSTDSVKCLGILEPGYWKNWPVTPTVDRLKQVENYLILAPAIRNMADRAADKMCGGRPYLAFHWRNRTGEICKPDHPCKDVGLIAAINKTAAVAADDLKKYTAKNNLSCTYVAFPPFAKRMITILAHAKVPNVVTRENITTSEYPEIERFKEDNYMMALIEQQICIRSKIFIAAMFSSWSGLVVRAREAIGAPTEKLTDIITWRDDRVSLKR